MSTTDVKIPKVWQEYRDALTIPDGYKLEWSGMWGWFLVNGENERNNFRLCDRTFGDLEQTPKGQDTNDIDYWTGHAISRSIEAIIAEKGKAVVLDLACGPLNKAAYQIAEKYGDQVEVKAVDLCSSTMAYTRPNLERKTGSVFDLPYDNGSIDVVYSFQFLTYFPMEERARAFEEILRVMGDGSHAVLDCLDTMASQHSWLANYRPEAEIHGLFPDFPGLFSNGLDDLFDIHTIPWAYSDEDGTLLFRPVTEFNDAMPGVYIMGSFHLTPHLHITKTVD